MDEITSNKIKTGKLLALIGCACTLFIPFFGTVILGAGTAITYSKNNNNELKHIFVINLIGLICNVIVLIMTIVQTIQMIN